MIEFVAFVAGCVIGGIAAGGAVSIDAGGAIAEAREVAQRFKMRFQESKEAISAQDILLAAKSSAIDELLAEIDRIKIERDTARAELDRIARKRSDIVSRGNRTRALRRRGGLLPAPINDTFHEGERA